MILQTGINGSAITCCDQIKVHPECFPIIIGRDDPFYADKGVRCLDLVRSAPAPQCKIGNILTEILKYMLTANCYHNQMPESRPTKRLLTSMAQ